MITITALMTLCKTIKGSDCPMCAYNTECDMARDYLENNNVTAKEIGHYFITKKGVVKNEQK